MRRRSLVILMMFAWLLTATPPVLHGQDQTNNPDALKKELADALNQLKAAQDRKNELATENEKLKAQLADMQKQIEELQRDAASWAQRSYEIRSREAAWNAMLSVDANLKARWEMMIELSRAELPRDLSQWKIVEPTTAPTTAPTTSPAPATAPATMPTTSPTTQK